MVTEKTAFEDDDEYDEDYWRVRYTKFDPVTGRLKSNNVLNKKKVTRQEMDDFFLE